MTLEKHLHSLLHTKMARLSCCFGVGIILTLSSVTYGQVIRLNPQAAADPKQNIRLGDIATIKGTDENTANMLANLVILPEVSGSRTLHAEAVLLAVITQVGPGPLADHLQIGGSATCEIQVGVKPKQSAMRPGESRQMADAAAARQSAAPSVANPAPGAAKAAAPLPTLSQLIITQLEQELSVGPDDLRVSFDTVNPLLDQAASPNRTWVLQPLMNTPLGSVQIEAQLIDGTRILQKLNIQAEVLKRERVLVAATPIGRGSVVTASSFKSEDSWMDRAMPTLLTNAKDVIGLEALRDLTVGSNLDSRDFKPVSMAERGDTVTVIFVHGNLKVQMKARAITEGKLHDTIQVRNDVTNELYEAVLIGKRLAVVGAVDEAEEAKLRETQ